MFFLRKSIPIAGIFVFSLFLLFGTTLSTVKAAPTSKEKAEKVEAEANKHSHKPYRYGEAGPDAFDCSGFTQYIYEQAIHLSLPRSAQDQANKGNTIAKNKIQKGDLLFFNTSGDGISHVGIYIGDDKMIHAANERNDITTSDITISYWKDRFIKAQRVL